jgi:hypothetical protein
MISAILAIIQPCSELNSVYYATDYFGWGAIVRRLAQLKLIRSEIGSNYNSDRIIHPKRACLRSLQPTYRNPLMPQP